jgi:hypothetical protein
MTAAITLRSGVTVWRAAIVAALCAATARAVETQNVTTLSDMAARVAAAPDGRLRLAYTARPGVCGEGSSISTHGHGHMQWERSRSEDVDWDEVCDDGPVRVVLEMRGHTPVAVHTYVGGRWRPLVAGGPTITDLGAVPATHAAEFLLGLAQRLPAIPGSEAIFPATLADSAVIWPTLSSLARDSSRPSRTRHQAVFWLGQAAADVTTALDSIAEDVAMDRDVREQAVFALSQRPREEGIPALIRIARTNHDPEIRRKALFWLGESNDPRAVALFEELLTGKSRK